MEYLYIFCLSIGSLIILFFLTKLMGNKEMSQLSLFDYINGITIGSIAAEMATSLEDNFMYPLIAMVVYGLSVFIISILSAKSLKVRRFMTGKSMIVFDNGKIYKGNLKKGKIDLNEMLVQARINGYFDLNNVQTVILESNGKLSFLPKSDQRPATPKDLNLQTEQEKLVIDVIIDGKVLSDNLKYTGNNKIWLQRKLKEQGITRVKDVFLATCDSKNILTVYKKINGALSRDVFQ